MRYEVGDFVKLNGCPFDEQIPGEQARYERLKEKIQKVTETDERHYASSGNQWIKTNLMSVDWISANWFSKVEKSKSKYEIITK